MTLQEIAELVRKHGSLAKASVALGKSPKYLSKVKRRLEKAPKKKRRDMAAFKSRFDRDTIMVNKIQTLLGSIAARGDVWIPESELREALGIGTVALAAYRKRFEDFIVEVDKKRVWFVDVKYANEARKLKLI